jgi:hypothetical protein
MARYTERVQKLLKRSAKFRQRIEKSLRKHDEDVDLVKLNAMLEAVDHEIVRLGRKSAPKRRKP